jgi:LPS sulfotransferase NodH
MNPRRPFVIITSQRTGSTLLVRSLDAAPEVFCAGEIFYEGRGIHHPEWQFPYRLLGSRWLGRLRDACSCGARASRHVRAFYEMAGPGTVAVGFKLMLSQLRQHPSLISCVAEQRVRRIFLVRDDVFSTALSYYSARASGRYHSDQVGGGGPPLQIEADLVKFADLVQSCRTEREHVLGMHGRHGGHLLTYEGLVGDWDAAIAGIGRYLGLDGICVAKALPKLSDGAQRVTVLNLAQVRAHCADLLADRPGPPSVTAGEM